MRRVTISALFFASMLSATAAQNSPTPPQKFESYSVSGLAVDMLGFQTTTPAHTLIEALKKEYSGDNQSVEVQNSVQSYTVKGVSIKLPPVPGMAKAYRAFPEKDESHELSFYFTGPSSGNYLVYMDRSVRYRDHLKSPTIESVVGQLTAKYGQPSQPVEKDLMGATYARWAYKNGEPVSCQKFTCGWIRDLAGYNMNSSALKSSRQEKAIDYEIGVKIDAHFTDKSKVERISMSFLDVRAYGPAVEADLAELKKRAEAEYERANTAVSAPKF